jgi:hypothetical protein
MRGTHIIALIAATLWVFALYAGLNGLDLVRAQHIPGWPSAGQIRYYVYIPAALLLLMVSAWGIAVLWRSIKVPVVIFILLTLLVLPVYLLAYTGGI